MVCTNHNIIIINIYRSTLLSASITSAGYLYVLGTIFNNIPKLLIAFYGVNILNKTSIMNKVRLCTNVLLIILFYIIDQYTVDLISVAINRPLEFSIESLILDSLFCIGLLVFMGYKKQGFLILTIYFIIELYIGMNFVLIYNPNYFIVSLPYFLSNIFCSIIFIVGYFNVRNNS